VNPSYVRIRVPKVEALRRFATWQGLDEVGPLAHATASQATELACDDLGQCKGQAVLVSEVADWSLFADLTGGLSAVTSASWLAFAGADDLVFAGYNDATPRPGPERSMPWAARHSASMSCARPWPRSASRGPDGLVRIALKRPFSDGTVAVDLDPLSLLSRLAASVPPPRLHTVRYAGVLAPASSSERASSPRPRQPRTVNDRGDPEESDRYELRQSAGGVRVLGRRTMGRFRQRAAFSSFERSRVGRRGQVQVVVAKSRPRCRGRGSAG